MIFKVTTPPLKSLTADLSFELLGNTSYTLLPNFFILIGMSEGVETVGWSARSPDKLGWRCDGSERGGGKREAADRAGWGGQCEDAGTAGAGLGTYENTVIMLLKSRKGCKMFPNDLFDLIPRAMLRLMYKPVT